MFVLLFPQTHQLGSPYGTLSRIYNRIKTSLRFSRNASSSPSFSSLARFLPSVLVRSLYTFCSTSHAFPLLHRDTFWLYEPKHAHKVSLSLYEYQLLLIAPSLWTRVVRWAMPCLLGNSISEAFEGEWTLESKLALRCRQPGIFMLS